MVKGKKRRIRWGRVIVAFLLCISLLFLVSIGLSKYFSFNDNGDELIQEEVIDDVIVEDKSKEYSISLVMVGDALIHDKIYNEAKVLGNGGYDFKPMLSLVKDIVSEYDLAYYNQETILGGSEIGVSSYPSFNSPYEVGDAFVDVGFNLVSLATNHTIDRGERAVINSRNYWNSKIDVLAVGS